MHVVVLDQAHVVLPFLTQPVPGLEHVGISGREVVRAVEHEGRGDALAGAGRGVTGLVELAGDRNDLFDLPAHIAAQGVWGSCWRWSLAGWVRACTSLSLPMLTLV